VNLLTYFKRSRYKINRDLGDIRVRKFLSPGLLCLDRSFVPLAAQYVDGKCVDIGCGEQPYRSYIESLGAAYESVDVEARAEDVTYISDIHDMGRVPQERFDCAICLEVLEHVSNPFVAVGEIGKVLKPGGRLILSVPHLSRIHEAPHDYFRYTRYGIQSILESNGFEVLEMKQTGALFSFLGHQWASMTNSLFWPIPVFRWVVFSTNVLLCVYPCYLLDQLFRKIELFPLSHVCVARKKN